MKKHNKQKFPFGAFAVILAVCILVSAASGAGGAFFMFSLLYSTPEQTTAPEFVIEETTTEELTASVTEAETEAETEAVTLPEDSTAARPTEVVTVYVPAEKPGNTLSKGEIYSEAVNSIVTITSSWKQYFSSILGSYYRPARMSGTGFCVSDNGYIVTNYHVVENAAELTVTDYSGKEYKAELVGCEPSNDFAVIKIDADTAAVRLGDSSALNVGDDIVVIGNALGELSYTYTDGIVSHLSRLVKLESGEEVNMFQTNAAINNGNSGGPVYNIRGEVVGIASAKYASEQIEGLGFCIPIDDVKEMISDIIVFGYVKGKPCLGITVQTVTSVMSNRHSLPQGCYIVALDKSSPCYEAGLRSGDVITKLGNKTIASAEDIRKYLSEKEAGDKANITYYSSGESKTVSIKIGEYKPSDPRTNYSNVYDF
ncbi:MAG: trypsin-like peptidase domain-containing protein [Clostridia bacterium]|nr:trypsin-like peptidase domain-containing protein [Clostridia bacterium]